MTDSSIERYIALLGSGQEAEAMSLLSALINNTETQRAALELRAEHQVKTGALDPALEDYESLLQLAPNSRINVQCAEILIRRGELERALNHAVSALQQEPQSSAILDLVHRCQTLIRRRAGGMSATSAPVFINAACALLESDPRTFPASVSPPIGRFLYDLVRMIRPTRMIETGTFIGYSTLCIAQAMEDNGHGHLHSFDLFDTKHRYFSPLVQQGQTPQEFVEAHLDYSHLRHRVTLVKGDSARNIRETFAPSDGFIDAAFVDGDHWISGCMRDWSAINGILAKNGLLILHDTNPEHCSWLGPRFLMEKLDQHLANEYRVLNLPTPEGFGIGILQKATDRKVQDWWPSLYELLVERLQINKYWRKK